MNEPRHHRPGIFWPVLLILVGLLLFLNNIGTIPGSGWDLVLRLWPLLLIVGGLDGLFRWRGLVGATLAIGLGVVFLLGNLGYLTVSAWDVLVRFWPVFIIAIGLDLIIGRRTTLAPWISLAVGILLTGGLIFLALSIAPAQLAPTEPISFDRLGATTASGRIEMPVGRLSLQAGADTTHLLDGTIRRFSGEGLVEDHSGSGTSADFHLSTRGFWTAVPVVGPNTNVNWDLKLNGAVSYDLQVESAVGEQVIDLSEVMLSNLRVQMATGRTTVILPPSGSYDARLEVAVGELVLVIPKDSPVRITLDTALTGVTVDPSLTRNGNIVTTPAMAKATGMAEVRVNVAVGAVRIEVR